MNKYLRNKLEKKKYLKRIKRLSRCLHSYIKSDGTIIYNPSTLDIINDNGYKIYKSTSTPCSCIMCSPYKYSRKIKHSKTF